METEAQMIKCLNELKMDGRANMRGSWRKWDEKRKRREITDVRSEKWKKIEVMTDEGKEGESIGIDGRK